MPVKVEKMTDAPIVILTYNDAIDVETVTFAFRESLKYLTPDMKKLFRISDMRLARIDFSQAIGILKAIQTNPDGSSVDPRIHGVFVGNQAMAEVYANAVGKMGVQIPFFPTIDDALAYIQLQLTSTSDQP